MSILDFLFGKKPLLKFSKEGRTYHDLPEKKWQDWKDRFEKNPEFDFKQHSGKAKAQQTSTKK
jgi:hypothetical protein